MSILDTEQEGNWRLQAWPTFSASTSAASTSTYIIPSEEKNDPSKKFDECSININTRIIKGHGFASFFPRTNCSTDTVEEILS